MVAADQSAGALTPVSRHRHQANQAVMTAKITSQAALGRVLRPATSVPAMAMPISRWERAMSASLAPARVQARATTSCPALTAATRSMTAAKTSRIHAGMLMP